MKSALIGSIAASAALAADQAHYGSAPYRSGPYGTAPHRDAPYGDRYGFREEDLPTYTGQATPTEVPFGGRSSNDPRDPDIKRMNSRGADPRLANVPGADPAAEFRTGDELIPLAERNKRTPDPVLLKMPKFRELIPGSGIYEPVEENYVKMKAPIFLVDPKFTKD